MEKNRHIQGEMTKEKNRYI